jgi:hypothetical protein
LPNLQGLLFQALTSQNTKEQHPKTTMSLTVVAA